MNLFKFLKHKEESVSRSSNARYVTNVDKYIPDITFTDTGNGYGDEEEKSEINMYVLKYINDFEKAVVQENKEVNSPIEVDRLATKIGMFYEKIRQVIDWKEEHLVRRSAIERILKRRLITKATGKGILLNEPPSLEFTESFIDELLRTGYFLNQPISKKKIPEIHSILKKYDYILKNNPLSNNNNNLTIKTKVEFYNWLTEIAASEIEECLDHSLKEHALINLMTNVIYSRIVVKPKKAISDEEKYIQTYIAVHKSIFNLDLPIINYRLLTYLYEDFTDYSDKSIKYFSDNIKEIWQEVENHTDYQWKGKFFEICEKYDAGYLIIGEVFNQIASEKRNIKEIIKDKIRFGTYIREEYRKRLSTLKRRLNRSAAYSTISIFVAGFASLIIFEYPVALWLTNEFSPWAIVVDIMIPTILMFILVAIIQPPHKGNYKRLLEEIKSIVYTRDKEDEYEIILNKKKNTFFTLVFSLIYIIGGFGSLYLIYKVFLYAGVPWTSLYIDAANVALVVFAAMIIRQKSRELTIDEDGGFLEMFLNFFSVPLARIGMWLSNKWKEYNFVSVFLNALIDVPFSTFLSLIADWRKFIKEKSSEIH